MRREFRNSSEGPNKIKFFLKQEVCMNVCLKTKKEATKDEKATFNSIQTKIAETLWVRRYFKTRHYGRVSGMD